MPAPIGNVPLRKFNHSTIMSTISGRITKPKKKAGKKKGAYWKFFDEVRYPGKNKLRFAICNECGKSVSPRSENILKHIKACPEIEVKYGRKEVDGFLEKFQNDGFDLPTLGQDVGEYVQSMPISGQLNFKVLHYLYSMRLPFTHLEKPCFYDLMRFCTKHMKGSSQMVMSSKELQKRYLPQICRKLDSEAFKFKTNVTVAVNQWIRGTKPFLSVSAIADGGDHFRALVEMEIPAEGVEVFARNTIASKIHDIESKNTLAFVSDGTPATDAICEKLSGDFESSLHLSCAVRSFNRLCCNLMRIPDFANTIQEVLNAANVNREASTSLNNIYICLTQLVANKPANEETVWAKAAELCAILDPVCATVTKLEEPKFRMSDCFLCFYRMIWSVQTRVQQTTYFQKCLGQVQGCLVEAFRNFVDNPMFKLATFLDLRYAVSFSASSLDDIHQAFNEYVGMRLRRCHREDALEDIMQEFTDFKSKSALLDQNYFFGGNCEHPRVALSVNKILSISPHSIGLGTAAEISQYLSQPMAAEMDTELLEMSLKADLYFQAIDHNERAIDITGPVPGQAPQGPLLEESGSAFWDKVKGITDGYETLPDTFERNKRFSSVEATDLSDVF